MRARSNPFFSPNIRLNRAKAHIDRLDNRIASFFKKQPYRSIVEPDAKGTYYVHKIKITKPIPDLFSTLAGDALEDLRAALDQTGYAAAIVAGKVSPKHTYFPIADSAVDFEHVIKGRCKDIPPEIVELFRSCQAHKGGNFPLWALNKLRQSIHTKLIPCAIITGGVEIRGMPVVDGGFKLFDPIWNGDNNEIAYMHSPIGTKLHYQVRIAPDIAFGEISEIRSAPAVAVLRDMDAAVRTILRETESRCRSLK